VTAPLVDLHGQHDHQSLLDPATHLDLLDRFGDHTSEVDAAARAYEAWHETRQALDASQLDARERAARLDLVEFQLAEIDRVAPHPGEDEELGATRVVLANADRLHRLCSEAYSELYDGDAAALTTLSRVWKRVGELASIDRTFEPFDAARADLASQLEDLAYALRERLTHLDASPARLQEVEDRLASLERLKRRHGASLNDVLAKRATLAAEREALSTGAERADALRADLESRTHDFLRAARALGQARRITAQRFARELATELADLAMPGARCDVRFREEELPVERWSRRGIDEGELYLSANVGEGPRPLARIASGGELSRVMLGLKTLATTDTAGKTLIFDEVDAGIGGRAADAVGARLGRLGSAFQVLCITHLPQVAAHADVHYRVAKDVRRGRTVTSVTPLEPRARTEEIARMMGGDGLSDAVLGAAQALIAERQRHKEKPKGEREGGRQAKAKAGGRRA
jgi:DNA repair protein RecN (Recombination protein N)